MRTYGSIRADEMQVGHVVEIYDVPMTAADVLVLPTEDTDMGQRPRVVIGWHDGTGTGFVDPDELFLLRAPRDER